MENGVGRPDFVETVDVSFIPRQVEVPPDQEFVRFD